MNCTNIKINSTLKRQKKWETSDAVTGEPTEAHALRPSHQTGSDRSGPPRAPVETEGPPPSVRLSVLIVTT
jgi:hypothetical protein